MMTAMDTLALRRGLVYEGTGDFLHAVSPTPVVTRATFAQGAEHGVEMVFREDSFDPVTRVRRGRLYQRDPNHQGLQAVPVGKVYNGPFGPLVGAPASVGVDFDGWYTSWCAGTTQGGVIEGQWIVLGQDGLATHWRIVAIERISTGDLLLTLRATSTLGALPALAPIIRTLAGETVEWRAVEAALEATVDAFHRQQPTPIVDVCRETARVILATWLGTVAAAKDLAEVIGKVPDSYQATRDAARIINRLHPRGKSAESERQAVKGHTLRPVAYEDAEACMQIVGLILREIGWAAP